MNRNFNLLATNALLKPNLRMQHQYRKFGFSRAFIEYLSLAMKPWLALPPLTFLLLLASGCSVTRLSAPGGLGSTPAAFAGALPCADCEAIDYTLDLFPEGSYRLEMRYRGKGDSPFVQIGRWDESADGVLLTLLGREPHRFTIESPDALRLLDRSGARIVSSLNYTLARIANAPLTDTRWSLTYIDGLAVIAVSGPRAAHILLDGAGRVAGSDGCNRIAGGYRLDGEQLAFSQLVSTRMACTEVMEQADRFGRALGEAASYRIAGDHLELLDDAGALLARFEVSTPDR
jgi:heat shock protein HslJ